jgi:hypothetical protein
MSWSELASLAEIVGALAVVITLIYVAKEIRQNSRALGIAALRDTTAQWNDWSSMLAGSGELADIVARVNQSDDALTEGEMLRFGAYAQSFFDNVESYRSLVVQHRVEKDLDVLQRIVARRIAQPGFADWWANNTADYDNEYVAWIEGIRASSGSDTRVH